MAHIDRIFHPANAGNDALRLFVAATIFTHGATRLAGADAALGPFLDSLGLPFGAALARALSAIEVAGALALALRVRHVAASVVLAALYLSGIALFHRRLGFFVVGPGNNGWEFSALLVACLLACAWEGRERGRERGRPRRPAAAPAAWSERIVARHTAGTDLLRLALCAIVFTHGAYRLHEGSSPILGQIIEEKGLPFGLVLAYMVSLAEIAGALLLALRLLVVPAGLVLLLIYATGVLWFHRHGGFFSVDPGNFKWENAGWEYSALLITCLLATLWSNRDGAAR